MPRSDARRGTKPGARLFLVYVLASLVPVAVLGAVLVHNEQNSGAARALAQGRAQAAVIVQMAIAPALNGRDLSAGITGSELARLRQATDLAIYSGSLTAMRLLSFSGDVVFADDGTTADPSLRSDPAFQAAAAGKTEVAVTSAPRGDSQAIRVLQPVVPNATGRSTGVLELYLPYAPIAAVVRAEERATYLRLGGGLLILYFVLALISWSTNRRLSRYAKRQAHDATHDGLTDLPNRAGFRQFAREVIRDRSGALVLIDLNRFKEVNDTLGHHAGDQLLQCVAQRLTEAVRTDDHVARLGGDEFGVILPDTTDRDSVLTLLESVHQALGSDVDIEGSTLTIEASFGVVFFPEHGTDLSQLMIDADAAMYQAKRGINRTVVWQPGAKAPTTRWHEVQAELARALEYDELVLHYQPKLDLADGHVVGVEALIRWNHPSRGLLLPAEFVPAAEASTLINPLTQWALRRALADQRAWKSRGADWTVAVNISARNLEWPDFASTVLRLLDAARGRPEELTLELTETAFAYDSATAEATIDALLRAGIHVSVDDFGTGSTGLLQLRTLAVNEIKIDRVFVRELADNSGDRNLARAVVELAHGMGSQVVAEGVEDDAAAAYLADIGCDQAQGYRYQRPAPWAELLVAFPPGRVTSLYPAEAVS